MLARARAQAAMASPPSAKNPSPIPPIAKNASPISPQGAREPSPTKPPVAVPPAPIASHPTPPAAAITTMPALHPAILATVATITESNKQPAIRAGSVNHPHVSLDIPQESPRATTASTSAAPDPRILIAYHDAVTTNCVSPTKPGAAPLNVSPNKPPADNRVVIKLNPYLTPPRSAAARTPTLSPSTDATPASQQEFNKRPVPTHVVEVRGEDAAKRSKLQGN